MKIRFLILFITAFAINVSAQNANNGFDVSNMNPKIKPGDDFFEYAAGEWLKKHPITPEYPRIGQFTLLDKLNRERVRDLITGISASNAQHGSNQQLIGDLYHLLMDSVRLNHDGAAPIMPYLNAIDQIKNIKEYQIEAAKLSLYNINIMLFDIDCDADREDASKNLIYISQDGLALSNPDYYLLQDSISAKIRNSYKLYIQTLFELAGTNTIEAKQNAADILDFEISIAQKSRSYTQLRKIKENYNKMSYRALVNDYSGIDWGNIFLFSAIPAVDSVSVNQPEFIKAVEDFYANTKLDLLKTYAKFTILCHCDDLLDDRFQNASFDFAKVLSGATKNKPRWERSVTFVNSKLGMAVGKLYAEKYFPESSKARMMQIVKNLQTALRQRIAESQWMSNTTKAKAYQKLDSFYVKIGYPDKWKDYSGLEIDPKKSLLENAFAIAKFNNRDFINRHVNKPTNRDEWYMTPQTVNAYYNPPTNEICFPAGILQPPFFNPDADEACNYGAIGVVVGHEMTHGFDDQGAQYDLNGNLRNWWTESDRLQFEARTDVMRKFFDNIEVLPGVHGNGSLTLGENIADNGGLNISFRAMQNYMKEHPLAPIDGLTPAQRFFLSYGLIWAENRTEQSLRDQVKNDPHSNARWRVNGALPHIDEWYKAFNIKKNSKLYVAPNKRVRVW
ncbi:MAG: M13 family metallopeptidase [Bacteroidales bacterium]|nr:M13 family metallopeptidase [Bacteroidales bacterium]